MAHPNLLDLRSCRVDLSRREVHRGGELLPLTPKEAELLGVLLAAAPRPVSREELLAGVWGYGPNVSTRTLDTTIYTLRTKVEAQLSAPDHIVTVRGLGYQFVVGGLEEQPSLTEAAPEPDPFVGRISELAQLQEALQRPGLVVITGAGGAGKTRLARRCFSLTRARYPGGAWFCELQEARSASQLQEVVGRAMRLQPNAEDGEQIGRALAARGPCLLVLDNLEQLVAQGALSALVEWGRAAPQLSLLCTSRERLRLPGERMMQISPLPLPPERLPPWTEALRAELLATDSVSLFLVRARAVAPKVELDEGTADDLCAVVRAVEGLPLALEMAAARLLLMPLPQLRARLAAPLQLLGGPASGRHSNLRSLVAWSWELLRSDEQRGLAAAGVFRGGFTLEAAEAVLPLPREAVLDLLQGLVEKSLLRATQRGRQAHRFELYAAVRDFVDERLVGEAALSAMWTQAQGRHAAYFAQIGEELALSGLHQHGSAERVRALTDELDNLRAAHEWASRTGDLRLLMQVVRALNTLYQVRGPARAAVELCRQTQQAQGLSPAAQALLCLMEGSARWLLCDLDECRRVLQAGLRWVEGTELEDLEGRLRSLFGRVMHALGRSEAGERELVEALALLRRRGSLWSEAHTLLFLGDIRRDQGLLSEAGGLYEQAVQISEEVGEPFGLALALTGLGHVMRLRGRHEPARQHWERALQLYREHGQLQREASMTGLIGQLHADRHDHAQALSCMERALELHRRVGHAGNEVEELLVLARLALDMGDAEAALRRLAEAQPTVGQLRGRRLRLRHQALSLELGLRGEESPELLRQASEIAHELSEAGEEMEAACLRCTVGLALARRGQLAQAADQHQAALAALHRWELSTESRLVRLLSLLQRSLHPQLDAEEADPDTEELRPA